MIISEDLDELSFRLLVSDNHESLKKPNQLSKMKAVRLRKASQFEDLVSYNSQRLLRSFERWGERSGVIGLNFDFTVELLKHILCLL